MLIIFDLDGTLLDSQAHILAAQRSAFAEVGIPAPSRQRSLSIVGLSLHEAFVELVGSEGPVEALTQAYARAWTAIRTAPDFTDVLYPGAADLVAALARRDDVSLGIATGKSRHGVDRVLAAQGWERLFATVQTADTHPSKPHPSMVLSALAETGTESKAAVMVGDTSFDMAMAAAAAVRSIGVTWGFHPRQALVEAGAAAIAADFGELGRLLGTPASAAA